MHTKTYKRRTFSIHQFEKEIFREEKSNEKKKSREATIKEHENSSQCVLSVSAIHCNKWRGIFGL